MTQFQPEVNNQKEVKEWILQRLIFVVKIRTEEQK